jgi:hypothetical protein
MALPFIILILIYLKSTNITTRSQPWQPLVRVWRPQLCHTLQSYEIKIYILIVLSLFSGLVTDLNRSRRVNFIYGVHDTSLCDNIFQWHKTGRWFSLGTPVFFTNKTDCHYIAEILLKVALNTINQTKSYSDNSVKIW